MVQTRRDRPTRAAVDTWVHELNALAHHLDNPPPDTPATTAQYRRLAQRGPTVHPRR